MKKLLILMLSAMTLASVAQDCNPFYKEYSNPYGIPPFSDIKTEHFVPAFKEGIKQQQAEYDAIANSRYAPTFANTIGALEESGKLLNKVSAVFYNLYSAETTPE